MTDTDRPLRARALTRLVGLLTRWGFLKHPHGREYAREHYTLTGRRVEDE